MLFYLLLGEDLILYYWTLFIIINSIYVILELIMINLWISIFTSNLYQCYVSRLQYINYVSMIQLSLLY